MNASELRPVEGRSVWDGSALDADKTWVCELSAAAASTLATAGKRLAARGTALRDIGYEDAGLGSLGEDLRAYEQELVFGRGVVLIRNVPVAAADRRELEATYWALGTCFGIGVSQNRRGDYLGDVIDLSDQQTSGRPFQNGGELIMHRDPIDVVGLLCLRHAKAGGISRIESSMRLHNLILADRPDLAARLYEGYIYHRLDEDRGETPPLTRAPVPVFGAQADGRIAAFFIPGPIRRAGGLGASIDALGTEAYHYFIAASKRPSLHSDMHLRPGDAQFLNNRVVLHSRTDYEDHPELERRRHMLRLWLMAPHWPAMAPAQRFFDDEDRCGGGVPPLGPAMTTSATS